jgi:hypothetical protein
MKKGTYVKIKHPWNNNQVGIVEETGAYIKDILYIKLTNGRYVGLTKNDIEVITENEYKELCMLELL